MLICTMILKKISHKAMEEIKYITHHDVCLTPCKYIKDIVVGSIGCASCKHYVKLEKGEKIIGCTYLEFNHSDSTLQKAMRFNDGKPKWSYVHYASLVPMIRVLEFGAIKYAPFNWQKPMPTTEILESMQRHLAALMDGEEVDKESGLPHMGHIQANAMFYNYHLAKELENKNTPSS